MSDIYIPGVNSQLGTDKLIENLMKVERVPRDNAAKRVTALQTQKTVWQDLNQRMIKLRDSSRGLYSFNNPFNTRTAKSADENVVTATAARDAVEETKSVTVSRIASADRFLSGELAKDFKVIAGQYDFSVGADKVKFRFSGGSLKEFADALTRNGRGIVRASVLSVSGSNQSLLIESMKTGSVNRLAFESDAPALGITIGMMAKTADRERTIPLANDSVQGIAAARDGNLAKVSGGILRLAPQSEASIPISPPASSDLTLEFSIKVTKLAGTEIAAPMPPPGPAVPATGSISVEGISIESDPSRAVLPEWKAPEAPPAVDDSRILSLVAGGTEISLGESADSGDFVKTAVRLADFGAGASALYLRNKSTGRTVELKDMRVYDPAAAGGYRPLHPISNAGDARVSMDGIEMTRGDNAVKDVIPGVTLQLRDVSAKPVKITVEPDRKAVKDALIQFVAYYNQLVAQINILTTRSQTTTAVNVTDNEATSTANDAIIQELDYLTDDERKTAQARLGILQGDFTLANIKSSLQQTLMNSYRTDAGTPLALLSQIGISTNSKQGTGVDRSRLRGYLEIDEAVLDNALAGNVATVKQLFGNDLNGDLIIDAGVAYQIDALMKPYVETGGIVSLKNSTLDSQIKDEQGRVDTYDKQLSDKQASLKTKYATMEGALQQMQATSNNIDNTFNKSSGQ